MNMFLLTKPCLATEFACIMRSEVGLGVLVRLQVISWMPFFNRSSFRVDPACLLALLWRMHFSTSMA